MKNKKIICGRIGMLIGIFILLTANVLAFAVSAKYHEGNPLFLPPGESMNIMYTLQNLGGASDINIKAEIISGDVIKFIDPDEIYTVPAGGKETVNFLIEVPNDAEIKDKYNVNVRFATVNENTPGSFALGSSIIQRFDVIVGEGRSIYEEKQIWWKYPLMIAVLLMAALIVVIFIIRNKKKIKKR